MVAMKKFECWKKDYIDNGDYQRLRVFDQVGSQLLSVNYQ